MDIEDSMPVRGYLTVWPTDIKSEATGTGDVLLCMHADRLAIALRLGRLQAERIVDLLKAELQDQDAVR